MIRRTYNSNSSLGKKSGAPLSREQALVKLTALCSRAEHCTFEMQEKLAKWGITGKEQESVIDYLIDEKYVDDERYTKAFIRSKMEYNGWGRRKIEQGLWMKHIDKSISKPLLDEITKEQWMERLKPLILQKRKSTKADNDYEMRQKILRFALGRGFSFDVINACIDVSDIDYSDEELD